MTNEKAKDPSAIVVPFGKYKGRTVAELIETDQNYAHWVTNQAWVAERFAELHAAILTRGAAPDDSPEHNAIQVRFLDETFRLATTLAAVPKRFRDVREEYRKRSLQWATVHVKNERITLELARKEAAYSMEAGYRHRIDYDLTKVARYQADLEKAEEALATIQASTFPFKSYVQFEERGIDVTLTGWFQYCDRNPTVGDEAAIVLKIEIKPTMGDDFPSVMRQMQRLKCDTLVLGEYTGRAVTAPQVRQMFGANGQKLIFVRDIEAELANARAEVQG